MNEPQEAVLEGFMEVSRKLFEALQVAAPILAKYGMKDDEAWAAYSQAISALNGINVYVHGTDEMAAAN